MAKILALVIALAFAGPARADETNRVTLEPVETDTITCRFLSWTISAAGTATVELRGVSAQTDSTPSGIITAGPTLSGTTDVSVLINPDYGCGTSGCRAGNIYQVKIKSTASDATPTCNFLVYVKENYLIP